MGRKSHVTAMSYNRDDRRLLYAVPDAGNLSSVLLGPTLMIIRDHQTKARPSFNVPSEFPTDFASSLF